MRLHPRVDADAADHASGCHTVVAGFGLPGMRDLDFGDKFIRYAQALDWPPGVVVEDLSFAAHLVLHRLQELNPAKLILVGAVSRGDGEPGTIRRYALKAPSPSRDDVQAALGEAASGAVDLAHTLSVVRHWGALPRDTVVVEVEAADLSFGVGFSEELANVMDPLLDVIREELDARSLDRRTALTVAAALGTVAYDHAGPCQTQPIASAGSNTAHPGITQLLEYSHAHAQRRALESLGNRLAPVLGLEQAARFRAASRGLGIAGDWYDVIPLTGGGAAFVIAHVPGDRGVAAATVIAQLRMAVRALALVKGDRPGLIVDRLDQLVRSSGVGEATTLVYMTVDPQNGELRLCNAGHCPPLMVGTGEVLTLVGGKSLPLGASTPRGPEFVGRLRPGSTMLLVTGGLLADGAGSVDEGRQRLHAAAKSGPAPLDAFCDSVFTSCLRSAPATNDASLMAVRLSG